QEDSTVAVTAGTVNITNAGGDGMVFNSASGSFTAGATTISGFNGTGVNFTGSGVNATFGVTTISNALNGGTGTGIDLSNTTGNAISFAGGSSISNVAVGVELSAGGTTATSAFALFTFGDGEGTIDKESSINATITVNAIGLAATGTYDFDDVNFTGMAGFPAATGSAMFVSAAAVNGAGDGSLLNPYSVQDADAIATAGTFAFLDGAYDFATLNGGLAFSLGSGQAAMGLDNGAGIVYGTTQPVNISGDFGLLGGIATRASTGNGTLSIINSAVGSIFTMDGSNTVSNITLAGSANTTSLISSTGGSGMIVNGVTMGGLATGNTALSFVSTTGTVTVQGNNINASGTSTTLASINGGTANINISKGTLPDAGNTPGTLTGGGVTISNMTGGGVTVTGASLNSLSVSGMGAATAININNTSITSTGVNAVNITGSAGNITFDAASSITGSATGFAFLASGGTGNITVNGSVTQNNAAAAISISNNTAGTIAFNGAVTASTSTATAVTLANNTGATINFNGNLGITTTTGSAIVATGGGTLGIGASGTVNLTTTGGRALDLNGITLGGVSIDSISVTGASNRGVSITSVAGTQLTVTGTTTITGNNIAADAITIISSSAAFDFQGLTTISGSNDEGIDLFGANGAVTFGSVNVSGTTGDGLDISNSTSNVTINGGTITAGATNGAVGIFQNAAGSVISFNNVSTTSGAGSNFILTNGSGTLSVVGGTHTHNGSNDVLDVESLTATGVVNFGGAIVHNGSGASAQAVEIDASAGTINMTGNISAPNGAQAVSIGNSSAITGGAITFSGTVNQTGGTRGVYIDNVNAGTIAFNNTVTLTGNSTFAIQVSDVAAPASVTFSSINLNNISNADAVYLSLNAGQIAINGGSINRTTHSAIGAYGSNLTVNNLSIGNNTSFAINGSAILVGNITGALRTISVSNSSLRSTAEAFKAEHGPGSSYRIALNGNTYESTTGVKAISIVGQSLNSVTVTSLNGGTVVGNNTGGGVLFNRVTFDSDPVTAGIQQVTAGTWNIGQGIGARVIGDGLNFQNPTGDLNYSGTLNIFNSCGTGLLVNAKTTTFALSGAGSGTINTSGGTALNLDPLTTNLTFGTVTSTNSGAGNPGVIFDGVVGSVTIGTLNVTNAGTDGFVVLNSSGNINLTNINITTAGGDGIRLANNIGSFNTTAGGATTIADTTGDGIDLTGLTTNPTVSMLGTVGITDFGGIGINFTGANVTAAFGVTTINNSANGNTGTAIDLSSTTGTRN
ncbi:MAG: beta strand repeat-containing protein, partial [Roseimicrobium sp.]